MYKAYHFPTASEFYFELRPKKKDLIKVLKKMGEDENYLGDIALNFEISKVKIIHNHPED